MGTFEYKAFISYSHRDTSWAQWLLTALETYRIPADVPAPHGMPKRGVGRIFRDRDEAGAATDLKEEIQRALIASEHLIVVASPNSARSKYVQAEIEAFAEANKGRERPGRILTLIVDGEPNITAGDTPDPRECFPPALRGGLRKADGTAFEPLAADARPVGDGRTRALAKLVSGLTDIRYDTLVRRDLTRRRRRRILAVAASLAGLTIAGVVGAVVIAGNLEQARLRAESESAARDVRTVTAVNNAERARRLLSRGNLDGAVELAQQSLDPAAGVPFIPQAYSVLYGALYNLGEPVELDLGLWGIETPTTARLGDGSYMTVGSSSATIWSPTSGVTYRRGDSGTNGLLTVAPDGSAAILQSSPWLVHYDVASREWHQIDVAGIDFDHGTPEEFVAVSHNRALGCVNDVVFSISWPDLQSGKGVEDWVSPEQDSFGCASITLTKDNTVLVGDMDGRIAEFSLEGEKLRTYDTGSSSDWIRWARTTDKYVFGGSISTGFVFLREGGAPILSLKEMFTNVDETTVSPDGRFLVAAHYDTEPAGFVIYNLETMGKTNVPCGACKAAGFTDDETFIAEASGVVVAFDLATGASKGAIHKFSRDVEETRYLPESKALLGLRQGTSEIALLDGTTRSAVVRDANADPGDYVTDVALVADDRIATATWRLGGEVSQPGRLQLWERLADGTAKEIVNDDLMALAPVHINIDPLSNGLFTVFSPDSFLDEGMQTIFDAQTGDQIYAAHRNDVSRPTADGLWFIVDEDAGLRAFDTRSRTSVPLAGVASEGFRQHWDIAGNVLVATTASGLVRFEFGPDGPVETPLPFERQTLAVCLTPDAQTTYVLLIGPDELIIEQRPATAAEATAATASISFKVEDEEEVGLLYDGYFMETSFGLDRPITCDAGKVAFREIGDTALVWDVAGGTAKIVTTASLDAPPKTAAQASSVTPEALSRAHLHSSDQSWTLEADGQVLASYTAEGTPLAAATFSPERGIVAAGFEDGTIMAWNGLYASAPMIEMRAHTGTVSMLEIRNGWLMTADWTGQIAMWPLLSAEELVAAALAP